jgi:hypothetical protein
MAKAIPTQANSLKHDGAELTEIVERELRSAIYAEFSACTCVRTEIDIRCCCVMGWDNVEMERDRVVGRVVGDACGG